MKKRKRAVVVFTVIFVVVFMYCCSPYRNGWECKKFLWGMKREGPDCLRLKSVGLHHESRKFFLWYDVPGGIENHVEEILSTKALIEKLLTETGEIPEEYDVWIQFTYLGDVISFSNTTYDYMVEETGGPGFVGHHLFKVCVFVNCNLSELSALENVKYLTLQYGTIMDDISGLENMRELIYMHMMGEPYEVTPDKTFTEDEIQEIKKMYPNCYIDCYPVDTY